MLSFPPFSSLTLQPHLRPPPPPPHTSIQLTWLLPNFHPIILTPSSNLVVNNSNELGPAEELDLPANKTSVTLSNLKYNTRYKFYLNAKTGRGAGPAISQEAATIVDEGKSANAVDLKSKWPKTMFMFYSTGERDEYLIWFMWIISITQVRESKHRINLQYIFTSVLVVHAKLKHTTLHSPDVFNSLAFIAEEHCIWYISLKTGLMATRNTFCIL